MYVVFVVFFFQAEDGIRDVERSRGLGDVYKRQVHGKSKERLETLRVEYESINKDVCNSISEYNKANDQLLSYEITARLKTDVDIFQTKLRNTTTQIQDMLECLSLIHI
eukprot:TRINITY_DN28790_c0_g1_i1.p3 TRINITY_DN28790_c0_g1~~TRINITY_DN28790_c0_g1_i1.p3  ORF type:complete len:109 (+),score=31.31 TRINITY_DN28790_c0_g1_i1:87-413(+)